MSGSGASLNRSPTTSPDYIPRQNATGPRRVAEDVRFMQPSGPQREGATMMMTARIRTGLGLRYARALVALGLALSVVSFAGCGGSSAGPTKLVSIAVTPPTASVAKGGMQQFTATGTYSDKTTKVLMTGVTWSSA